ncbi:LLM class flavin-dependent oxidoreductase [Ornithinimicrobium tianjinense]|uniref:FAD-binding PCMH-type domain-containing protein n=1 Tax=Ornithinimicrobium tianjinense TaxID=1195761 RepID=A0A917BGI7_9MICO|nr:LLM class flavin-dependent oxidoreductase [Ornithinimicrobium tianjinense]GGF39948.1 hypothetical protein GCM10011366_04450 [Ornithinimicrobium tianjinense]
MPSYGHTLRFGVEVRAPAAAPGVVVEAAVLAEQLGADLVLLPEGEDEGGLDAWSLATWTAGRTTTAHVGATRLDPLARPASTLARAAASLQLLSGERALLSLAAGEDPRRLVAAEETVAVLRAMQDTSQPRAPLRGTHQHLDGAEPGPALDREVPVWLHGSHEKAAALAGRVADGWMVDLAELSDERDQAQELARLTAALDSAATGAGRDPREVRRAAVLRADDPLDTDGLVALAVDHGISVLVLPVDGAAGLTARDRYLLERIAPTVRERVEDALPPGTLTDRPVRRADVRARRRPGIAYDEVPESLAGATVEPGDSAFARVRSTYLRGGDPGLVLRPGTVGEVVEAVGFARSHRHLPLGIRSGGHGISGRSTNDGGLVIDVGRLDDITVLDEAARLVRIGPGARWRDVATALQPHGWALSSGDYGGVGVGGLATAGGIGFLGRAHGLTIDHVRAVEMVLADGSLVRASATEHPELFWAVRGAGANFGIAVAFEFQVDQVGDVGWAQLAFQVDDAAAYLQAFGRVVAATPRRTTPFLILSRGVAHVMAMVDSSDPDEIVADLQPFAEIAPLVQQQVVVAPYAAVMNMFPESPHAGRGEPVSRSVLVREITPAFAAASADLIASGAAHWYQIRSVGGAVADVPADATAFAHRDAGFSLTVMGADAGRVDRWFDRVRAHAQGLYLSFESDPDPARVVEAFPPATLERLRRLKAELDPDNLFRDNFPIVHHGTRSAS